MSTRYWGTTNLIGPSGSLGDYSLGIRNSHNSSPSILRALRKFFDTKSQDIVDACLEIFNGLSAESAGYFFEEIVCQKISDEAYRVTQKKVSCCTVSTAYFF